MVTLIDAATILWTTAMGTAAIYAAACVAYAFRSPELFRDKSRSEAHRLMPLWARAAWRTCQASALGYAAVLVTMWWRFAP